MQIATFEYTDRNGKQSKREVLVLSKPSDKLTAIDLGELSPEDMNSFAKEYAKLQEKFFAEVDTLKLQFDIANNFRQFIPDKMVNVQFETV